MTTTSDYTEDIAIIGLAGRFPGAPDVETFWHNLCAGVESSSFFSEEDLDAAGVTAEVRNHPNFVRTGKVLDDVELFDAGFFSITPREAEIIDPQQRLFLECAWEALEHAGYHADAYPGAIGVYAGMGMSTYLLFNLSPQYDLIDLVGSYQTKIATDKDFLPTRISYKLNLKGPSIGVQTACSTSLVAVHLACQSLLNGECDMALAGGVSILQPQKTGYIYQTGMILSPDGHCRAFDAQAQGTVRGNGLGLVILKRLPAAVADGDTIHAVIKGSAINNDGAMKIGYTAPSVESQRDVIAQAHMVARVPAETISYVEAHGTGTPLGDPIEIEAITQAFRASTEKKQFCAIGSVKTNIGHLDTAAGVTGLIKTVLMLEHKLIPPSLHFETPNPKIDFANSPFYVNTTLSTWKAGPTPLRAGLSATGIGGTNAHIVLEEAPALPAASTSRPAQLLVLSARSSAALDRAALNLARYLKQHPELPLADVAHTLQVGRKRFDHRRALVCTSVEEALRMLEARDPEHVWSAHQEMTDRPVVFMFPGQGAQYAGMGRELYVGEPVFRAAIDQCAELLAPHLGLDLREVLYPDLKIEDRRSKIEDSVSSILYPLSSILDLDETWLTQPALFVTEYALARLWMAWGVRPQAMIGHSIGEYVAACLAGVFALEDALRLVARRGQLMQSAPTGAMLAVDLSEVDLLPRLNGQLALAVVNGLKSCVVAGPAQAIRAFQEQLTQEQVVCRPLFTSHAFHSPMMDSIVEQFADDVRQVRMRPPQVPFISNISGRWITADEATDAMYWARQLRQPVRFHEGLQSVMQASDRALLEVGPGHTLSTLARQHPDAAPGQTVLSSLRHPHDRQPDLIFLLNTLGKLWIAGAAIDWPGFYACERRRRIPLPTYPFERQRYWVTPQRAVQRVERAPATGKQTNLDNWFYLPSWKRTQAPRRLAPDALAALPRRWLVLLDNQGVGAALAQRLTHAAQTVIRVAAGRQFAAVEPGLYSIDVRAPADYRALLRELDAQNLLPDMIIHLTSLTADEAGSSQAARFDHMQDCGFFSLLFLAQALGGQHPRPTRLWVVSNQLQQVESADVVCAEKATLGGICKVIPQENDSITCGLIDISAAPSAVAPTQELIDRLLAEFSAPSSDPLIAYRGRYRWTQTFERVRLGHSPEPIGPLRERGVYVITGGLGRVGLVLAEYLARTLRARLVLTARSALPDRPQWAGWLATHGDDDVSGTIRRLQALEAAGADVLVASADVADEDQMRTVIAQTLDRFGMIDGVIHAAGLAGQKALRLISELDKAECELQFRAKARGAYVLRQVLRGVQPDFCLLMSSNAAVLGGVGLAAYAAANTFLDAFAPQLDDEPIHWISATWDRWTIGEDGRAAPGIQTSIDQYTMTSAECVEAFRRVVSAAPASNVVVSTGDLASRLELWSKRDSDQTSEHPGGQTSSTPYARPELSTAYIPPRTEVERAIVEIWQDLLGIDRLGIYDNFFDLGGSSLIGVKVIAQLKQRLGVDIPVVKLFEGPTVRALAELISQEAELPSYDQPVSRGRLRKENLKRKRQIHEHH